MPDALEIHPLTPDRWDDFAALFGPRGACAGCWCMFPRLPRAEWKRGQGAGNRRAMERLVRGGTVPGLIAYQDGVPIGWVATSPRDDMVTLRRSRLFPPTAEAGVWSISCFFVARSHRGRGVTVKLIRAATRWARARGARVVEGYPVEPAADAAMPAAFAWTGLGSAFRRAGFRTAARPSPRRSLVRRRA
jgi:GNAT superfamily N-acetyltransferase